MKKKKEKYLGSKYVRPDKPGKRGEKPYFKKYNHNHPHYLHTVSPDDAVEVPVNFPTVGITITEVPSTTRASTFYPTVVETTVSESWDGSSGDADSLTSSGTPAGIVVLIVLLILLAIAGTIFLIFFWNRRGQGPALTFSAVMSRLQQISMPTIPTINLNPRRPSVAFARFSNERVSSINIGQMSSGGIERTDRVDTDTDPVDVNMPDETTTSGIGFANVVYDIIGVSDGGTGGSGGGDAELNKSSSLATDMDNPKHVYDLVEVHGGSVGGSGLQTSKTIENKEE